MGEGRETSQMCCSHSSVGSHLWQLRVSPPRQAQLEAGPGFVWVGTERGVGAKQCVQTILHVRQSQHSLLGRAPDTQPLLGLFVPCLMAGERNSAGAAGKAAGPWGAERLSDLEIKWKHDKSGLFLPKPTFITL